MSELIQMYATSFLVLRLSDVTNRRFPSSFFPCLVALSKEVLYKLQVWHYVIRNGKGTKKKKKATNPSPDRTFSGKTPVTEKDSCLERGNALASKYMGADLTSGPGHQEPWQNHQKLRAEGTPHIHPHPATGVPLSPPPHSRRPGAPRLPAAWPRGPPSEPRASEHLLGSPLKTPPSGHRCPEDGGKKSRWPAQSRALPHPAPPGNCSLEPLLMRDICYPQAVGSGKTSPSNLLLNLRGGSHLLIKSRRSFFSRMDKNVNNNARLPSLQKLPSRRLPREFSLCLSFPV